MSQNVEHHRVPIVLPETLGRASFCKFPSWALFAVPAQDQDSQGFASRTGMSFV